MAPLAISLSLCRMLHSQRATVVLFVASLALVLSSCGSSSGEDSSPEADSSAAGETTAAPAGETTTTEGDAPPAGPVGAQVTVGDETFEATNVGSCLGVGDTFSAQFFNDDESVTISLELPPEGWESQPEGINNPPSIQVFDSQGDVQVSWLSGEAEFGNSEAVSEVGTYSFDVEAGTAQGDATFVDQNLVDEGETADVLEGSFSITCG